MATCAISQSDLIMSRSQIRGSSHEKVLKIIVYDSVQFSKATKIISLQVYVATDPVDIPLMVTAPFIGGDRLGQSTAVTGIY